jgi:uncharacterized Zn-binding protein involved in type VI secretion
MLNAARVGDAIGHGGALTTGSPDVYINGIPAGFVTSAAFCALHVSVQAVAIGSGTVYINGSPAAMVGAVTSCGAPVASGSHDVFVGS